MNQQQLKAGGDVLAASISVSVVLGALSTVITILAGLATLVYTLVRLWESKTVQRLLEKRRKRG